MLTTALLFGLLLVATITDWRRRKIYNWTAYPGILAALGLNAAATLWGFDAVSGTQAHVFWLGLVGIEASLLGFLLCSAVMLVCYVFFPGGVGGGDVKLLAMVGAMLGMMPGLEALLWTFIFGGCMALVMLVWQVGLLELLRRTIGYLWRSLRLKKADSLSEQERTPLKTRLFLSPSAVLAVIVVHWQLIY